MSVKLEAFVVKDISNIPNCHVEIARDRYSHLNGLWFSDVNLHKDRLEVDVLVGADHLWEFQNNHVIRGRHDEPVAIETKLGWVLSGPLKIECDATDESANIVTVNNVVAMTGLDRQVERLWD